MSIIFPIILVSLAAFVSGDKFVFPPAAGATGETISDLGFAVGQTINLQWITPNAQDLDFWLMQDEVSNVICSKNNQLHAQCARIATISPNNGSIPWTVTRMVMTSTNIYYIYAFNSSTSTVDFNSHYFNITDASSSSSSTTQAQSSTAATSVTSTSNNKLAVAVGVGLGVPLGIIALVGLLWVLLQHQRKMRIVQGHTIKLPVLGVYSHG